MKKSIAATAAAVALAVLLAGCAAPAKSSSASESATSASSEASTVSSSSESSASATVSDVSSSASAASKEAEEVTWTKAKTAEEAAKGAGFETFGVPETIKAGKLEFKDPTFAYSGKVAQAFYETGAAAIDVRKADGKRDTPLSDRNKNKFAATWTDTFDGISVTQYGASKDETTYMTWNDGTKAYGVTYQGLGGEEMSFTSDEVKTIVEAIKEAENPKKEEPQSAETTKPSTAAVVAPESEDAEEVETQDGGGLADVDVESVIWENGLGEVVSYEQVEGTNGVWYWEVVTHDVNGNEVTHYIDAEGSVADTSLAGGTVEGGMNLSSGDLENIIWENGLGEYEGTWYDGEDGTWHVTVTDTEGDEHEVVIDDETGEIL